MSKPAPWFDVDRKGLAEIIERGGGKTRIGRELVSNVWDEPGVTTCEVLLVPEEGKPLVTIVVRDDAPEGFSALHHAWTLFATSRKRGNADVRGRFNLGEKLVLAMCVEASIVTTTGGVMFDHRGRTITRTKRERGSEFTGTMRMTRAELEEMRADLRKLIPPAGIVTTIDGETLKQRTPIQTFRTMLWTEIAEGPEGILCRRIKHAEVRLFTPEPGEVASIYELGIPVVETGDAMHIDVRQKVPLNLERDNVTPSYLRELRAEVLNAAHGKMSASQQAAAWVTDAIASPYASPSATAAIIDSRFGSKRVAYDPSDKEANNRAAAEGYTVVHGGSLPAEVWERVRDQQLIPAAGKICGTPNPNTPGAPPLKEIGEDSCSAETRRGLRVYRHLARELLGHDIRIRLALEPAWPFIAVWERGLRSLVLNLGKLSASHFESIEAIIELALHEFAHEAEGNHLDDKYHEELCRLGARLAISASTFALEWRMFPLDREQIDSQQDRDRRAVELAG